MSKSKWRPLLAISMALAFLSLLCVFDAQRAEACSCLRPSVESSYNSSDNVVLAAPAVEVNLGGETWYLARVRHNYKGCIERGRWVIMTTSSSSASCGVELEVGTNYLLNADEDGSLLGIPKLSIGLCDYNVEASQLTAEDREFLSTRTVCCGDDCSCADGSEPVNCLLDPCEVAPTCPDGECVANYCGGCNAEFYDASGYAVCDDSNQCATDDDCPQGQWCREAAPDGEREGGFECVPFVGEGGACNGFTLPWFYERCSPELACDTPDFVADAPGTCSRTCAEDGECDEGQYCASDNLCDSDGLCERDVDCNLAGNQYVHAECTGHGVCDEPSSSCGWQCGEPRCLDLQGFDTGPCDAVLGWGILAGECSEISGCSSEPFALFESESDCEASCAGAECTPGEVTEPDECGNVCGCTEDGIWVCTLIACECESDADCMVTGCSSQVCAPEPVATTCEWRPEYECYQDAAITTCGCQAGQCAWADTTALSQCLEARGSDM